MARVMAFLTMVVPINFFIHSLVSVDACDNSPQRRRKAAVTRARGGLPLSNTPAVAGTSIVIGSATARLCDCNHRFVAFPRGRHYGAGVSANRANALRPTAADRLLSPWMMLDEVSLTS